MKTAIFARRACAFGLSAALVLACAPVYAFAGDATTDGATEVTATYNQADAQTLTNNLAKRFIITGTDASITNNTAPAAYGLSAAGMYEYIDVATVKANLKKAQESDPYFSVGTLAKYMLILQAAGVDTSEYESQLSVVEGDYSLASNVAILRAADSQNTELVSGLIDAIVSQINDDGVYGYTWDGVFYSDYMTTAQALEALCAYSQNETASATASKIVKALVAGQADDGSYDSSVASTAEVVVALSMAGEQSALDQVAPKAIANLLSNANTDLNDIIKTDTNGVYDTQMCSALVLQALIADGYMPNNVFATQTIKLSPASKTVKYKKVKKAKQSVNIKVTGVKGKLTAKVANKKSKKALKVKTSGKTKVKVAVKKGTRKGTYKVKVSAAASSIYAKSATKTIKVVVK